MESTSQLELKDFESSPMRCLAHELKRLNMSTTGRDMQRRLLENMFPVHDFSNIACTTLDEDSIQSLMKRLDTLNKYAKLLQGKKCELVDSTSQRLESASNEIAKNLEDAENNRTIDTFLHDFSTLGKGNFPVEDSIESVSSDFLLSIDRKLCEEGRGSFYDNMVDKQQIDTTTAIKITFEDIDSKLRVACSDDDEDDDDGCSLSSQDEEDVHDGKHLQLPNHLKVPGMGSVDSGVPSSPIMRSPSVRRRRVRWHSFQKSCERESMLLSNNIMALSAGQLNVLKKLSLLRLTALMERYSCTNRTSWHWTVPKLLKKLKVPDYKDKNIFGVPLLTIAERWGSPLPHSILLALSYLSRVAKDSIGIFRKSGMKSRIEKLRSQIEQNPNKLDLEGYSVYDIADVLKQYFRELPQPLLTSKLSDTFISIHKDVPNELRLQAMQLAILLMPDENRHVLQTLLFFLNDIASHSHTNQMSETNLATCFVPAFFHLCGGGSDTIKLGSAPKKLKRSVSLQCQKELDDTRAAQDCLAGMMKCARFLFCVPDDVMMKCQFSYIEQGEPVPLSELGQNGMDPGVDDDYHHYIDNCFADLLQETALATRSPTKWDLHWEQDEITVSYRKVNDGYPLRVWRAVTEIHASPQQILKRLIKERHLWDDEIVQWEVLETLDESTDVFYYEMQSVAPSVKRDFVVLRSWRTNLNGGSCGVVMTSVKHPNEPTTCGVRGALLACRCLIEPIGLGRSKFTFISRTDFRGTSSRYYNKAVSPRVVSSSVKKVRDSFNCGPDGPETNV